MKKMKKNNMVSILKSLVGVLALGAASSAFASDEDVYSFVSLGLNKTNYHELDKKFNFSYTPNLTVGLAKDYQLSDNWFVTNKVGLRAQHASFYGVNENEDRLYGDVKELGLVAGSRFKYSGLSDTVRPFVEVEASISDANIRYNHSQQDQWQKAVTISTGLEFTISGDNTFSIGLGYTDSSDKDEFGSNFNH